MTHISCYDDTEVKIAALCEALDMTEPELIDYLLDIAQVDDEIAAILDTI